MSGAWTGFDPFNITDVVNTSGATNGRWTGITAFGSTDRVDLSGATNGVWTEFRLIYGGVFVDGAVH